MAKPLRTVALLAAIAAGTCANARDIALDLRAPSKAGRRAMVKSAGFVKSAVESVQRASNLAAGATDVGEVATGDALSVTLFDDVTLDITLGEKMPSPLGGDVFLAGIDGKDGAKTAVVLRDETGLTIDVQDTRSGKVYKVVSTAEGVKVKEMKPEGESHCGCPKDTPSLNLSAIGETANVSSAAAHAEAVTVTMAEQGNTCASMSSLEQAHPAKPSCG